METVAFLQQQPIFGGITDTAMQALIPLFRELDFPQGALIVREGDEGDSLFVICHGSVEVLKADGGTEDDDHLGSRIAVLQKGDVFGEMELIDMQRRSASIRALTPVNALALTNGDLFQIYQSDPPTFTLIVLNLARELSRRLRRLDEFVGHQLSASAATNGQ
ncbi:MAG: cyclic nucleotide-binding domain-containing protein [Candidatus Accumulibacter sp.]|nr:cyclic nucleotide-binding domain-containing protein [Accumulibacter sp.]